MLKGHLFHQRVSQLEQQLDFLACFSRIFLQQFTG
jgi:hypothetical protein